MDNDTTMDPVFDSVDFDENASVGEDDDRGEKEAKKSKNRSAKQPITTRQKSLKQKRDEEEYQTMKGIASSITKRYKEQNQTQEETSVRAFGLYVTKILAELN